MLGLTPLRSAVSCTEKIPTPLRRTSLPSTSDSVRVSNTIWIVSLAAFLVLPVFSARILAYSIVVIAVVSIAFVI